MYNIQMNKHMKHMNIKSEGEQNFHVHNARQVA